MTSPEEKATLAPEIERLLATEPERKQLQVGVVTRLLAYFDSVYKVLNVKHPSCHTSIVVWMTEDVDSPNNPFQGPIPLLCRLPSDLTTYDYREANDERAGIIGRASGELNPKAAELLNLPTQELEGLIAKIDERINEIGDRKKRPSIVEALKKWEEETGYCKSPLVTESTKHNLEVALEDFYSHYTKILGVPENKNR